MAYGFLETGEIRKLFWWEATVHWGRKDENIGQELERGFVVIRMLRMRLLERIWLQAG